MTWCEESRVVADQGGSRVLADHGEYDLNEWRILQKSLCHS